MSGPAVVAVASAVTLWLAIASDDGLVTEDYYRQGLAASQTLQRSARAAAAELEASLRVGADRLSVRLGASDRKFALPEKLRVTLSHPTRAGLDQTQLLGGGAGHYQGEFRLPAAGHWLVQIEDEAGTWRLLGNVVLPAAGDTLIGGAATSSD